MVTMHKKKPADKTTIIKALFEQDVLKLKTRGKQAMHTFLNKREAEVIKSITDFRKLNDLPPSDNFPSGMDQGVPLSTPVRGPMDKYRKQASSSAAAGSSTDAILVSEPDGRTNRLLRRAHANAQIARADAGGTPIQVEQVSPAAPPPSCLT